MLCYYGRDSCAQLVDDAVAADGCKLSKEGIELADDGISMSR